MNPEPTKSWAKSELPRKYDFADVGAGFQSSVRVGNPLERIDRVDHRNDRVAFGQQRPNVFLQFACDRCLLARGARTQTRCKNRRPSRKKRAEIELDAAATRHG